MRCPICKGKGQLPDPRKIERDQTKARRSMAKVLRFHGYTIRQIAKFIGWKSPRSVVLALEK